MSSAPCTSVLRAQVAEELGQVLIDHSARSLGRALGRVGHAITARGTDLSDWPALDLLLLAADHDNLRQSLIACLMGADAPAVGESTQAIPELLTLISAASRHQILATDTLRDGRVSANEARTLRAAIETRRQQEDAVLLPALRAVEVR